MKNKLTRIISYLFIVLFNPEYFRGSKRQKIFQASKNIFGGWYHKNKIPFKWGKKISIFCQIMFQHLVHGILIIYHDDLNWGFSCCLLKQTLAFYYSFCCKRLAHENSLIFIYSPCDYRFPLIFCLPLDC